MLVLLTAFYPLAIWFGQKHVEPRWLSLSLLLVILTRIHLLKKYRMSGIFIVAAIVLAIFAVWKNALLPLKLYPFMVNLGMLLLFGFSLFYPPPIVERIARVKEPILSPAAVLYTRRVTQVWCAFFVFNGGMALCTSFFASDATWSLYNGFIAYLLMGALFASEYLFRLHFRRTHDV